MRPNVTHFLCLALLSFELASPLARAEPANEALPLWPGAAPNAKGSEPADAPSLAVYLPAREKATGTAIVVCPGGGYHVHAYDHEGVQVARRLNEIGIAAFVLSYRLKPRYEPSDALLDANRAVRLVRAKAADFKLDLHHVGILGFSAGGHLTAMAGTHHDPGDPSASDPIERQSSRPDFLVLAYPVTGPREVQPSTYADAAAAVSSTTPPAFLFHTSEDTGVPPENSLRFYSALHKAGVPAELHIFRAGPHGVGLAPGDPAAGAWFALLSAWMRQSKFLTRETRVPATIHVTLGGEPLSWGWVTLVPTGPGAQNRPVVVAFLAGSKDGTIKLDAEHGPCPGTYSVEIRRVAKAITNAPTVEDAALVSPPNLTCEVPSHTSARLTFELPEPPGHGK